MATMDSIQIDHDRHLLHVTYSGNFKLSDAEANFHDILDTLVEHKLTKVLIDGRHVIGEPEPIERFYYGKHVAEAVAQAINRHRIEVPQFAYVLHEPLLDPKRFGETVAVNRGMRIKVVSDLKEAEWWLGLEASK